jgi:hypothetical protein
MLPLEEGSTTDSFNRSTTSSSLPHDDSCFDLSEDDIGMLDEALWTQIDATGDIMGLMQECDDEPDIPPCMYESAELLHGDDAANDSFMPFWQSTESSSTVGTSCGSTDEPIEQAQKPLQVHAQALPARAGAAPNQIATVIAQPIPAEQCTGSSKSGSRGPLPSEPEKLLKLAYEMGRLPRPCEGKDWRTAAPSPSYRPLPLTPGHHARLPSAAHPLPSYAPHSSAVGSLVRRPVRLRRSVPRDQGVMRP